MRRTTKKFVPVMMAADFTEVTEGTKGYLKGNVATSSAITSGSAIMNEIEMAYEAPVSMNDATVLTNVEAK